MNGYHYGYNAADPLTSETVNGVTRTYGYDAANQLTNDNGTPHTYDKAGNRTDPGYVTGPGNRLLSDGTWSYTYDDAGNLVKKSKGAAAETWTYSYDAAGQLTAASKSASDGGPATDTVGFTYDAYGNRLTRTAWNASSGTTTERYAYDGWDTAKPDPVGGEAFDAWIDLDGAGNVTARRLFGPDFDQPLARQDAAGNVAWYGADRLGSVRTVFDNAGTITGARDYAGFGAITAASGSGLDRYAFAGMSWDPTLGLSGTPSGGRWYDAAAGRWTAEDPLGADPSNPYRYVGNAPTTATDPSGLEVTFKGLGGGAVVVYDRDGRLIGGLITVGGVTYVRKGGRMAPLEDVIQAESSFWWRPAGNDKFEAEESWRKWFAKNGSPLNPNGNPNATVVRGTDLDEYLNQLSCQGPTFAGQMGTFNGDSYLRAGREAAALVREMLADLAVEALKQYAIGKALQFVGFLTVGGWTILRGKGGRVIGVLNPAGERATAAEIKALAEEFARRRSGGNFHPPPAALPKVQPNPKYQDHLPPAKNVPPGACPPSKSGWASPPRASSDRELAVTGGRDEAPGIGGTNRGRLENSAEPPTNGGPRVPKPGDPDFVGPIAPRTMPAAGQRGIWDIASDLERGAAAEARLGGRTGLHFDFPVIDRFENGVATSVKTMDLGRSSYQNVQQITSTGQRYIDAASGFAVSGPVRRAGVIIRPSQVTQRALDLVVPPWATLAQRQALQGLVEYGARQNPPVVVRIVEMQ